MWLCGVSGLKFAGVIWDAMGFWGGGEVRERMVRIYFRDKESRHRQSSMRMVFLSNVIVRSQKQSLATFSLYIHNVLTGNYFEGIFSV